MGSTEISSNESFFEILFYQNPQPMWLFDTVTLNFLEVNDAALKHYGYTIEEFLSMSIRDIRPPEDLERLNTIVENLSGANTYKRSFRHILKSGNIIHVQIVSYPVNFEGYQARLVMVHDVTESTLHIERFNLIAKATHDAVWDWNLETGSVWWSDSFLEMFGYKAEEVDNTFSSWISRVHPDDYIRVVEGINKAMQSKEINWSDQYRLRRADGTYAYILDRGYALFENGVAKRMLGSMMDITHQIEMQQAREETESLLQTITSASPIVLWMSDQAGSIVYINPKWQEWSNADLAHTLGEGMLQAIHPEDRERVAGLYTKAHAIECEFQADYRIIHKDGSVRWITALGSPRYLNDGTYIGFVGSCTDMTRQKHMELQKDEFISTVSHELKTPITSIKAYEQLLTRSNIVQEPKSKEFLSRMRVQINRLDSLVKDLLDISRIESGKLTFHESEQDMNILLAEVINDLQLVFPSHRLIITENHCCKVHADRNRVIQLITNLVDNAVKYSPNADKVYISLTCNDEYLTCCIRDFGRGILKEQQPFVFDRFYQVNDVYKSPGLGIGLYLCKEIVKRQNGKIWFESVYGEGTAFYFSLPRREQGA